MLADKSGKFQSAIGREINSASETHLDSLRLITNFFSINSLYSFSIRHFSYRDHSIQLRFYFSFNIKFIF